jgi:hypothetical protein
LPAIGVARFLAEPTALIKTSEDSAEVPGVQTQPSAEFGGRRFLAMGKLVEHSNFSQGKRAPIRLFAQDSDLLRVEAVEPPYGRNALIKMAHKHLLLL